MLFRSASWDQQEIAVFSQAEISALTVSGNGASVTGAPSYLPANGSFLLRYNALQTTWFCVQSAVLPGGPTYAATSWTPAYNGTGQTGSVTYTGRLTRNGRQYTYEILVEVGAAPGDQLVWTYAGDTITCSSSPQPPVPWGTYAMAPVAAGAGAVFGILASAAGSPVFAMNEPGGGATLTLTTGMQLHFAVTYTV